LEVLPLELLEGFAGEALDSLAGVDEEEADEAEVEASFEPPASSLDELASFDAAGDSRFLADELELALDERESVVYQPLPLKTIPTG
jgi:hypothetical protein